MEGPISINNTEPKINTNSKSKKIALSIAILVIVGFALYYGLTMFKQKQTENARQKRISESAAWLDMQTEQMTKAEKGAVGKALEKEAKQYKPTPMEQQQTLDFLNS